MNGFAKRSQASLDGGRGLPSGPRPRVNPHRPDNTKVLEQEKPRPKPTVSERVESSVLVDLKDPVQMHLLAETALFDSKDYKILSTEEVDDLKKQCQSLNQRIEQTRSNLAIQSKYRDAAISMSRLYSPSRTDGKRRSLLGNRNSGGREAAREAEAELEVIQKKCEGLAMELRELEQRIMDPQRRLLQHTAGILQYAHKAATKRTASTPKMPFISGAPASPESMYTSSQDRNSLDFLVDSFVFDEASLYRSFDTSEIPASRAPPTPIEIPLKSPVREQTKQLVEEGERLREENEELRTRTESLLAEINSMKSQETDQWRLVSDTESKLERFNSQLREVVVQADPAKNRSYQESPRGQARPGDMIGTHLDYLEDGLFALGDSQGGSPEVARKLQDLNGEVRSVLHDLDPDHPPPPDTGLGIDEQVVYLQDSFRAMRGELQRASELRNSRSADRQKTEQSEAVLMGLWDIIQSGYADARQRKQERRKTRTEKGLEPEEDDMSDSEPVDLNESYSLPAFSNKIQWLYSQATRLQEQKGVLKRQIKQQRELNSRSDSEKEQMMKGKTNEVEQTRALLDEVEKEKDAIRTQLSQAYEDLENLQNGRPEESAAIDEAREQLRQRDDQIAALETETRGVQTRLAAAEANIEVISAQLREANDAKDAAEMAMEEKQSTIESMEQELEQMTGMYAEIKMEATLAKAELDGAYGSRKERAAEAAALQSTSESSKMQNRVEALEKELKATANDLTDVVKQSLESEKKIGELEDELDRVKTERTRLRDERERMNDDFDRQIRNATSELEGRMEGEITRLRKEKERLQDELDGARLRSTSGPMSPGLGGSSKTSFLTDQYRSGLRAERKKYEEQLRAEQMARRRLEDELRAFKRAQGPGKSPLSPR